MFHLLINLFNYDRHDNWAVKLMAIEYQKEYKLLERSGVIITPKVAYDFLSNVGGIKQ